MQNTHTTGKVNANGKLGYIVARSQSSPEVTTLNGLKNFVTERHSFTGALEELRISNTMKEQPESREMPAVSPITTQVRCPCGCYLKPAVGVNIRTREKSTMQLHVVGSEILNYQGRIYSPEDIAPIWKKIVVLGFGSHQQKLRDSIPKVLQYASVLEARLYPICN